MLAKIKVRVSSILWQHTTDKATKYAAIVENYLQNEEMKIAVQTMMQLTRFMIIIH